MPADAIGFASVADRLFILTDALICSVSAEEIRIIATTEEGDGQATIQWRFDGSIRGPLSIYDVDDDVLWQAGPTFIGAENPRIFTDGSTVTYSGPMRIDSGLGGEGKLDHSNIRVTCP